MSSQTFELYPRNRAANLDMGLFANPTSEYRGTPFWSWNNKLDAAQLKRQIDVFEKMGFGGAHMHPRTGLATAYMGEDFLQIVRQCVNYFKSKKMLGWLYDEDRWPSGFAGGLVTQHPEFRSRHLLWTKRPYGGGEAAQSGYSSAAGKRNENGELLFTYQVRLEGGLLTDYRRLDNGQQAAAGTVKWYAYLETAHTDSWFNNQTYVDTLNPAAIKKFIEVTHERYLSAVGDEFGKTIPAIFTDEPQFTHKQTFNAAEDERDLTIPFTGDLLESYRQAYGQSLEDFLPELFWELPSGRASVARYRYHDHVAERFSSAFADQIGQWCQAHGLALTGHMMEEPRLQSQTSALGEAMRSYRAFQLPGIDLLCDWREYTTAKQAQSATHQYGRPGVLSELYGVTNWDFDFVGHKRQGDWQAALGITVRVPHLAWVSMAGEAKRDYPAAIGYQSPWHERYKLIEDYFSRINVVMTRGRPRVRVGVIHPVESYWLAFGPQEQTRMERQEREEAFENTTRWLLFASVDFDFVSESLLPRQMPTASTDGQFHVGKMSYDLVIVPNMRTIRGTTLDRLEAFADGGGKLVFAGEIPSLVDAQPSDRAAKLASRCQSIRLTQRQMLQAAHETRDLEIVYQDGSPSDCLIHQLREDGSVRYLFICNTERNEGKHVTVRLRGHWKMSELDCFSGTKLQRAARYTDETTELEHYFHGHGSVLLRLEPGQEQISVAAQPQYHDIARLEGPLAVKLSEPNVLLLDQAQWRIDQGQWQPLEEILRLDNVVRKQLGLPGRSGAIAQPWTDTTATKKLATVQLRYTFESSVAVKGLKLALENAQQTRLSLDGKELGNVPDGWWVDECIQTVAIGGIDPGRHELVLTTEFTNKSYLENAYLLGDFGVDVAGRTARLIQPVRQLCFGDYTRQGLAFYAGNITYQSKIHGDGKPLRLHVPHFKAPLLTVELDGKEIGPIAFAPYAIDLGTVSPGEHSLQITAYGNRFNSFGQLHDMLHRHWCGPEAWRSEGDLWSYEYQLRPMGILSAPMIQGI